MPPTTPTTSDLTPWTLTGRNASTGHGPVADARRLLSSIQAIIDADADVRQQAVRQSHLSSLATSLKSSVGSLIRYLFLNAPASSTPPPPSHAPHRAHADLIRPRLKQATALLDFAIATPSPSPDALFLLAEMNMHGNWTHPRNYTRAHALYSALASSTGNATAQHMLGFLYATGLAAPAVPRDQAKAQLYHTFAALGGDIRSQMTLAYRWHAGVGCPRDCEQAVHYYKQVARRAMEYYRQGPPGGRTLAHDAHRWADEEGGVYGFGASVAVHPAAAAHGGMGGAHGLGSAANSLAGPDASMEDVVEYLDLLAKKGDVRATYNLGKMYYEGSHYLPRNLPRAMRYFSLVARHFWDGSSATSSEKRPTLSSPPTILERLAAKAAAHLGVMFLRGEDGIAQDFAKAHLWLARGGRDMGDAMALHFLGLMYFDGLGDVPRNVPEALVLFQAAAAKDHPLAQTHLGIILLDQGDVQAATHYFELASRYGGIAPLFYLAEIHDWGLLGNGGARAAGSPDSQKEAEPRDPHQCNIAAAYYKLVAEKAEGLHSAFAEANRAYDAGNLQTALLLSLMAAEQGYEAAQANVAFLLDEQRSVTPLRDLTRRLGTQFQTPRERLGDDALLAPVLRENPDMALVYWTRSARQHNGDSLLKMGDYYYYGIGGSARDTGLNTRTNDTTDDDGDSDRLGNAVACYQTAAESYHSAQAFFNLGWMHENGLGVAAQDFHMAKRYYDLALEASPNAYLPVKLALLKLRARRLWGWVTGTGGMRGGSGGGDGSDVSADKEDNTYKYKTWTEWIAAFVSDSDDHDDRDVGRSYHESEYYDSSGSAEAAAAAAARRRQQRRQQTSGRGVSSSEDDDLDDELYYYAAARRAAEEANEDPDGAHARRDYYDYDEDDYALGDDDLFEMFFIFGLVFLLGLLMYLRASRAANRARQQEQQRQQQQQQQQQEQRRQGGADAGDTGAARPGPNAGRDGAGGDNDRGRDARFFPRPGDADYPAYLAGAIGR
ncbi:ERAD-associated protein [Ascosphaera acerosa]|nr:ERAD-associated protein [Ascosphaera acerosa]